MAKGKILKEAQKEISLRKSNAENIANLYMQKALSCEEYKTLYNQKMSALIENAKQEAYGNAPQIDITEFDKKLDNLLTKLNIKKELLSPAYTCKKCNDTGYINSKMCSCLKEEINKKLLEKSGFNHKLKSFEDCKLPTNIQNTLKKWCDKDSQYKIILFCGKTGVGKTFVTECMANRLIENEQIVYFSSAFNMNQLLLNYRTTFDSSKNEFLEDLLEPDYLFIDDLGTEPIFKNVTVEGLHNVLSDRIEKNKYTIISTNLSLDGIEQTYGERIFSRLVNKKTSLLINVENEDLRLKK